MEITIPYPELPEQSCRVIRDLSKDGTTGLVVP